MLKEASSNPIGKDIILHPGKDSLQRPMAIIPADLREIGQSAAHVFEPRLIGLFVRNQLNRRRTASHGLDQPRQGADGDLFFAADEVNVIAFFEDMVGGGIRRYRGVFTHSDDRGSGVFPDAKFRQ